jgi:hypothetical protein
MRTLQDLTIATGAIAHRIGRAIWRGLRADTVFDRLRLICAVMIVLGPLLSVIEWYNTHRIEHILQHGVPALATVTGTEVSKGRSTTYSVDLAWRDAHGTAYHVTRVVVLPPFFAQVSRTTPAPKVRIKYLADRETSRWTVALLDDATFRLKRSIPGWLVVSLMGLAGLVPLMLWRSWRRRDAAQVA